MIPVTQGATVDPAQSKSRKTAIEIDSLRKEFGNQEVLKDVSLKLFYGENLVVIGKSGSGKSVLIQCIVRLLNPDAGIITVLGENMVSLSGNKLGELRKKIGFLFQSGALYDSMTVRQNLEFPLRRIKRKLTQEERNEKIREVLEQVGLYDALDKMPA